MLRRQHVCKNTSYKGGIIIVKEMMFYQAKVSYEYTYVIAIMSYKEIMQTGIKLYFIISCI